MLTALDSNILIDIWTGDRANAPAAAAALRKAQASGVVLMADIAYAEICAMFATQLQCDSFVQSLDVRVERLTPASSFLASRIWVSYLKSGGKRIRILPDFLIAGHASQQADALLTRDLGFYRSYFPKLEVIDPRTA